MFKDDEISWSCAINESSQDTLYDIHNHYQHLFCSNFTLFSDALLEFSNTFLRSSLKFRYPVFSNAHKQRQHTHIHTRHTNTTRTHTTQINTHRTQTPHRDHTHRDHTQIQHRCTDLTHTQLHTYSMDPKYITETHTQSIQPHTYTQTHCRYTDRPQIPIPHTHRVRNSSWDFVSPCLLYPNLCPVSTRFIISFTSYLLLLVSSRHPTPSQIAFPSIPQSNHQHKTVVTNEKGHYTMSKHSKWIKIEYQTPLILKPLCNFCTSEYLTDPVLFKPPDPLLCFSCAPLSEEHPHSSSLFSWSQDLHRFPLLHSPLSIHSRSLDFTFYFPSALLGYFP